MDGIRTFLIFAYVIFFIILANVADTVCDDPNAWVFKECHADWGQVWMIFAPVLITIEGIFWKTRRIINNGESIITIIIVATIVAITLWQYGIPLLKEENFERVGREGISLILFGSIIATIPIILIIDFLFVCLINLYLKSHSTMREKLQNRRSVINRQKFIAGETQKYTDSTAKEYSKRIEGFLDHLRCQHNEPEKALAGLRKALVDLREDTTLSTNHKKQIFKKMNIKKLVRVSIKTPNDKTLILEKIDLIMKLK